MSERNPGRALTIRLAAISDNEALARLSGQLGYSATPEQITKRLADLQQNSDHAVFVAESSGSVIGWAHVYSYRSQIPLLESDLMAEVGGLVIDEQARGGGAGTLLMARAEEWALARGCAAVSLRTNVIRAEAHKFYEKLGFNKVKTQHAYRKNL